MHSNLISQAQVSFGATRDFVIQAALKTLHARSVPVTGDVEVSEIRGYLLGVPTIRETPYVGIYIGVPYFCKPPCRDPLPIPSTLGSLVASGQDKGDEKLKWAHA